MASPIHTYGANCRLAPVVEPNAFDDTPPIAAQFFYSSGFSIDETQSQGPLVGTSDFKGPAVRWRPFGEGDNNALETAWLSVISEEDRRLHREATGNKRLGRLFGEANNRRLAALVRAMAARHFDKHGGDLIRLNSPVPDSDPEGGILGGPACCAELYIDVSSELQNTFCALARKRQRALGLETVVQAVVAELQRLGSAPEPRYKDGEPWSTGDLNFSPQSLASSDRAGATPNRPVQTGPYMAQDVAGSEQSVRDTTLQLGVAMASASRGLVDDGISGTPFVRVESPGPTSNTTSNLPPHPDNTRGLSPNPNLDTSEDILGQLHGSEKLYARETKEIVVGISRLHMVSIPVLQMKPVYWSPINDISVVMRATWFYRDTMLPMPAAVANQLEAGYRELKPYTRTWSDELRCAIEVGPLGEEKVSHRLWPSEDAQTGRDVLGTEDDVISQDPFCAARCFRGEAASQGSINPAPGDGPGNPAHKSFLSYDVLYQNDTKAFLLKPSLKPSGYYGRRPVAKIMRGLTIGIPVVRGFDRAMWERLYDKKPTTRIGREQTAGTGSAPHGNISQCPACEAVNERGRITDLILVFHGIGQKFAERVESFHFTHAINAFRKEVNVELRDPVVQGVLKEGHNGIMVLPVNWRHSLSFDDGVAENNKKGHTQESFGLKDIEPTSIPAVRRILSDILFDVPYWMSHHKGTMVEALVKEANRIYRLWCQNNPGFHTKGRVHLIGHSLGSAMAIEVLSRQPNRAPAPDLTSPILQSSCFEFDTTNLFLAGSPAGFFLLLERGALIPRRGRSKPGSDANDVNDMNLTGEQGFFGCLSVDNIYNILAKEDPIAYLLNGTIDPAYAASLKKAYVLSTATSLLQQVGEVMRSILPGKVASPAAADPGAHKPATIRLPSQLELEVHDFTREENSERKAYLLNDNGQVDYHLPSSGGPLEIQYLNMLSAHSSYWLSRDFIRFICIEVGRRPGKTHTVPALRAQKLTRQELGMRK